MASSREPWVGGVQRTFGRDDRIDGVLRTRIGAPLGTELDVKAADKRANGGPLREAAITLSPVDENLYSGA